ncbi:uncharacterized protein C16orf95 homolog [Rhynchonycteris naso]
MLCGSLKPALVSRGRLVLSSLGTDLGLARLRGQTVGNASAFHREPISCHEMHVHRGRHLTGWTHASQGRERGRRGADAGRGLSRGHFRAPSVPVGSVSAHPHPSASALASASLRWLVSCGQDRDHTSPRNMCPSPSAVHREPICCECQSRFRGHLPGPKAEAALPYWVPLSLRPQNQIIKMVRLDVPKASKTCPCPCHRFGGLLPVPRDQAAMPYWVPRVLRSHKKVVRRQQSFKGIKGILGNSPRKYSAS